jgi:voltage-gated potassium channel
MPPAYDKAIVALTFVSVAVVVAEASIPEGEHMPALIALDLVLCGIFLLDFAVRMARAPRKLTFLRRNWLDLVGSVPLFGPLRAMRLVRVVRILRLARVGSLALRALRNRGLIAPSRALSNLAVVTFFLWLMAGLGFFLAEYGENETVTGLDDALWWSMTTLSTVGYGDIFPKTATGRLIAGTTMVVGVGVLGALAAMIASAMIELRERARRGLRSYTMNNHLLVLGWSSKARLAIDEFLRDPRHAGQKVCIVADLDENPVDLEDVAYVRGDRTTREALTRASAAEAAHAIVFARDPSDPRSDHETALTVLVLRRLNQAALVSAELVEARNREHLEAVGCSSVIDVSAVTSALLVRAVRDPGVPEIVIDLVSTEAGWDLHRMPVEAELLGKTYRDLVVSLIDRGIGVVGLSRAGKQLLTPAPATVLLAGDEAFVVSHEPGES